MPCLRVDLAPCVRVFFNPNIFGIFRYFLEDQDVSFFLYLLKILWRLFISLRCDIFKERLYLVQKYFWAGSYTFFQLCLKPDLLRKPMLTRGYIRKTQDLVFLTEANVSKCKLLGFRVYVSLVLYLWASLVSSWCFCRTVFWVVTLYFLQSF